MASIRRTVEFEEILALAERGVVRRLALPEELAVLFLQGGGSLAFAMVPMNLYLPAKPVDVLHTGAWTGKAIGELKKIAAHRLPASTEAEKFARLPPAEQIALHPNASYLYSSTHNTIEAPHAREFPATHHAP